MFIGFCWDIFLDIFLIFFSTVVTISTKNIELLIIFLNKDIQKKIRLSLCSKNEKTSKIISRKKNYKEFFWNIFRWMQLFEKNSLNSAYYFLKHLDSYF